MAEQKVKKTPQFVRTMIMISLLNNDERPSIQDLTKRFNVNLRTVQRDIENFKKFDIEIENKNGILSLKDIEMFNRVTFSELEQLMLHVSMNMMTDISMTSERRMNKLMSKVLEPDYESSYIVKLDPFEDININSDTLNLIEDAIELKRVIRFVLDGVHVKTSPFKIINIDEVWYLFGRDSQSKKLRTYYIKDMQAINLTQINFNEENDVDDIIEGIQTPWYEDEDEFEVEVEVLQNIAHYFKRKKHLLSQKILEEREDGSLLISFTVTSDEEVDNLIKSWLPHIRVLYPQSLKNKIKEDIENYLEFLD